MCGIVGVIGKATNGFTYLLQETFQDMLICDAIRGEDSTGAFQVSMQGNAEYIKLASHPFNLIKTSEYREWKARGWKNGRIMVGHNRKATTGVISNDNAHPFAFGPIMLVHNGAVDNFRSLVHHKEREKHNVEVDSHAIALLFARENPINVIPEIRGAFAFVWYNAQTKQLHFIRNSERPLSIVTVNGDTFFASEKGMLRWLLARRGITASIGELKPGCLLTVNQDNQWETTEIKVYEKPVHVPVSQPTRHLPVTIKESVAQNTTPFRVRTPPQIPFEKSFNIHYGNDKPIVLDDELPFPQIIFTVDDYRKMSEEAVEPPVWQLWGPALDSDHIQVKANFRGTEEEVDALAYESHLSAVIGRVTEKLVNGHMDQIVYASHPKRVKITVTPGDNALPITKEHLEYIMKGTCACGPQSIAVDSIEIPKDGVYIRDGFLTAVGCRWCVEGTPACKSSCVEKAGTCDYCVNAKKEREKENEKTPAAAVQVGK